MLRATCSLTGRRLSSSSMLMASASVGKSRRLAVMHPSRFGAVLGGFSNSTATRQLINSRTLSSESSQKAKETTKGKAKEGGADEETAELVLTPGQKVVAGTRLTMWAGIFVFASACAYYIGRELIPTKMSPNRIFDKAFEVVRQDPQVQQRFGDSLKAYGRDHGGHREGRRNFVEHTEYTDQEDGSKRTRVRFNLEGQFGSAFVFAEQSSDMPAGELAYVLVQDKQGGRVITVVDNRSAMAAARMAGGSKEGMEAFGNLLSGGKK